MHLSATSDHVPANYTTYCHLLFNLTIYAEVEVHVKSKFAVYFTRAHFYSLSERIIREKKFFLVIFNTLV